MSLPDRTKAEQETFEQLSEFKQWFAESLEEKWLSRRLNVQELQSIEVEMVGTEISVTISGRPADEAFARLQKLNSR